MNIKQNFNLHTHTYRCHHAFGHDEQYIHAGIEAGFKTLGFSEHVPFYDHDLYGERMAYDELENYLQVMNNYKEKYKDQIEILVGFEFEYYDSQSEYLKNLKKRCDFMINGQHMKYLDGYDYYFYNNDEDILEYADNICKAMRCGLTDVVAHPDYFMLGRRNFNDTCITVANMIGKCAEETNTPIEINLKGINKGKLLYNVGERYPYPFYEFWKELSKYDIKVLYGYDAHEPIALTQMENVQIADEILKDFHLNFIDSFK